MESYLRTFLTECPASPMTHILPIQGGPELQHLTLSQPLDASLYLTRACNLDCKTCYVNAGKRAPDELQTDQWMQVLDNLKGLGVKVVYLLGGEPLLVRGITRIIRRAKDDGFYVALSTNGLLLNENNARKLKNSGLDAMQISLDSPQAQENNELRGRFDLVLAGARIAASTGISISISTTVTDLNKSAAEMIYLANGLGAKEVNFIAVQPFGRARKQGLSLSKERGEKFLSALRSVAEQAPHVTLNGFRFYLNRDEFERAAAEASSIKGYFTCPAGRTHIAINWKGDVYGCDLLMNDAFKEGNALRDSLAEIWRNGFSLYRNWLPERCAKCPYVNSCQGGCPARSLLTEDGVDPWCPINRASHPDRRGKDQPS
ncbi:MAG: radical SAM/SPASM domain-containing protein [Thermoprotei archaeon]